MKDFSEIEDKYLKKTFKDNDEINWNFIFRNYKFSEEQLREWENKISEKGWKVFAEKQQNISEEFISDNLQKLMKNKKYIDNNVLRNNQLSESFFIKNYNKLNEESWKIISKEQNLSLKFIADNKNYLDFNLLKKNPFYNNKYGGLNVRRSFNKKNINKFVDIINDKEIEESLKKEIENFKDNQEEDLTNVNDLKENKEVSIGVNNKPFLEKKELENKNLESINEFTNVVQKDMVGIYDEMVSMSKNKESKNLTKKDVSLHLNNSITSSNSLKEISNFADMCVEDYESMYNSMLKMQRGEKVDFEEITLNYKRGLKNIKTLAEMVKVLKQSNDELQKIVSDFEHFKKQEDENLINDLVEDLTDLNKEEMETDNSIKKQENDYNTINNTKVNLMSENNKLENEIQEIKDNKDSEELLFGEFLNENEKILKQENEKLRNMDSTFNKENKKFIYKEKSIYDNLSIKTNTKNNEGSKFELVETETDKNVENNKNNVVVYEDNEDSKFELVETEMVEEITIDSLKLNGQNKPLLKHSEINKNDMKLSVDDLKVIEYKNNEKSKFELVESNSESNEISFEKLDELNEKNKSLLKECTLTKEDLKLPNLNSKYKTVDTSKDNSDKKEVKPSNNNSNKKEVKSSTNKQKQK
jgi:hypothetical protein